MPEGENEYSVIDELTYDYSGNQIKKITDDADTLLFVGAADFYDGANQDDEYYYDDNGNLTYDANKGISSIAYNHQNLPTRVEFTNGHEILYLYSATGAKLRVASITNGNVRLEPVTGTDSASLQEVVRDTTVVDYCGPYIYRDGKLAMLLTEEGYLSFTLPSEGTGEASYHYYVIDHLGSNRVVLNQNGTVEQVNHHYPFGVEFGQGASLGGQPYKFGGLEQQPMHGLNLYDNHARQYDPMLGRFTGVDPLAEADYGVSPYASCRNNPVSMVDPTGMQPFEVYRSSTYELYPEGYIDWVFGKYLPSREGNFGGGFGGGGSGSSFGSSNFGGISTGGSSSRYGRYESVYRTEYGYTAITLDKEYRLYWSREVYEGQQWIWDDYGTGTYERAGLIYDSRGNLIGERGIQSVPLSFYIIASVTGAHNVARLLLLSNAKEGVSTPTFIVSKGGTAFPVPKGATGPIGAQSGKGIQYVGGSGGNGLNSNVSGFRFMDPVTTGKYPYPGGYGSYFNSVGQPINPFTGQTIAPSNPWWHIIAK